LRILKDALRILEDALRILLSFNPDDVAFAEAFRATLFVESPDLEVFFSPVLFEDYRPLELRHADAFVLFVGPSGVEERQTRELNAAVGKAEQNGEFAIVPVLAANARTPQGLPIDLRWISVPVVTNRDRARQVIGALDRNQSSAQLDCNRSGMVDRGRLLRQGRLG
jgi:hypothetical protein